jgi:regulator of sirC expression with transglutaminase-like and TPR domain
MTDPRAALEAIGQLPDAEIDIAAAALQLARLSVPDAAAVASAGSHLSALARDAVTLPETESVGDRAAALAGLLAGRYGYAGDGETYDDLANANLIRVIERRRGLPVTLGILWLHCAAAAGWDAHGVDFPAHFLIALRAGGMQIVLDPFAGGTPLGPPDLRALLKRVEGPRAELRPDLLRPMTTREVLIRLQNNIRTRRLAAGDVEGALACVEDTLRFAPGAAPLWREAGMMNQRLDRVTAALRCFERFLALVPEGESAGRARLMMDELRSRLN